MIFRNLNWQKLLIYLALLVSSLLSTSLLQLKQIEKNQDIKTIVQYEEENKQIEQQLTFLSHSPNLGWENILADWIYLQFIQYFGDDDARSKTGYSLSDEYFTELVRRDPHFIRGLLLMEVGNSLFAAEPDKSVALLTEAAEKISPVFLSDIGPYYLWRTVGNDQLLFFGDTEAAKNAYQKTVEWAKQYAQKYNDSDSQKIVRISENSIRFLENNPDSQEARIGAWASVLANRPDKKTVERVIKEIQKLGAVVRIGTNGSIEIIPSQKD